MNQGNIESCWITVDQYAARANGLTNTISFRNLYEEAINGLKEVHRFDGLMLLRSKGVNGQIIDEAMLAEFVSGGISAKPLRTRQLCSWMTTLLS